MLLLQRGSKGGISPLREDQPVAYAIGFCLQGPMCPGGGERATPQTPGPRRRLAYPE
jgi:hypothetical protein